MVRAVPARFEGVASAYGEEAYRRLAESCAVVVGVGGVGSWCAEALVRTGVGSIVMVDLDEVCVSNTNRQLCATHGTVGKPKASVLEERFKAINPHVCVTALLDFVDADNVDAVVTGDAWNSAAPPAVVVDAIDDVPNKAQLLTSCHRHGIPVVTCGGAGGATDPAATLRRGDLGSAGGDALLKATRRAMKERCGFAPPSGGRGLPWGVPAVYCAQTGHRKAERTDTGRPCDRYGSAVAVTASMGFFAAAAALDAMLSDADGL